MPLQLPTAAGGVETGWTVEVCASTVAVGVFVTQVLLGKVLIISTVTGESCLMVEVELKVGIVPRPSSKSSQVQALVE